MSKSKPATEIKRQENALKLIKQGLKPSERSQHNSRCVSVDRMPNILRRSAELSPKRTNYDRARLNNSQLQQSLNMLQKNIKMQRDLINHGRTQASSNEVNRSGMGKNREYFANLIKDGLYKENQLQKLRLAAQRRRNLPQLA